MKAEELLERIEDKQDELGFGMGNDIVRSSWIICLDWVKDQIKELREGVEEDGS